MKLTMLSKLILLLLGVNSLTTAAPWSAEETCANVTGVAFFANEDDPTCTTYVYCYNTNGSVRYFINTCKSNQYFDSSLRICGTAKPDYCTTGAPWSAEEVCANVTGVALFANEDDPTCTTYVYCYLTNGSPKSLIKKCKTDQYFDSSFSICGTTKPAYCT